ncbi:hypothetical protein LTR04_000202, partial [Oleoguttula sp. CCFEE 6159]
TTLPPVGKETRQEDEPQISEVVVDEDALIEQRRKKREALRAKYKDQVTPLHTQALQLRTESEPATPQTDTGEDSSTRSGQHSHTMYWELANALDTVSPMATSPNTPQVYSASASPAAFSITKDMDLADDSRAPTGAGDEDDEPSAADYDPTLDMEEDKTRAKQKEMGHNVSTAVEDQTPNDRKPASSLEQGVGAPHTALESKKEFDMFADDDEDDDMFSQDPAQPTTPQEAKPKQLDRSLLDDWADSDGYYRIIVDELLGGRYHVRALLGKGMYANVFRATDIKANKLVAIKIVRNNSTLRKQGMKEVAMLQRLGEADPEDRRHIVRLERHFDHKGHLCIVFEHLGDNLREVVKKFGRDRGISLPAVQSYAQQIFTGLAFMRKCNVIHADLKPDNILVSNDEKHKLLKIADLGSAMDASDNEPREYLASRFYRAPELILGFRYDSAIDVWSIGCTLYELYTGKILFGAPNNNQMLRSMQECRGKFPWRWLKKGDNSHLHWVDDGIFKSHEIDKATGRPVVRMITFMKPTRDLKTRVLAAATSLSTKEKLELEPFIDLLDKCLQVNPEKRLTPAEALRHPFINPPAAKARVTSMAPPLMIPSQLRGARLAPKNPFAKKH